MRSGTKTGIGLITQSGLCETVELVGLEFLIDDFEQILDLLAKLRRKVGHRQRGLQIAARLSVGTELIIEDAKLEARRGKLGIVEAKLFVSADRGFDVAVARRGHGILNRIAKIGRLRQHARK